MRIEIFGDLDFPFKETGFSYGSGETDACQFRYWQTRFDDDNFLALTDFFPQLGKMGFGFLNRK